jgi:peptidyl-prolyl cis-trans isomerase C
MASVVVDGVEIPERLISEEAQNHPAATAAEARAQAAKALAIRALLLARARELRLEAQPEPLEDGREETPEEALIRAVLDLEVHAPEADEAACRRVYDSRPEAFSAPPLYAASHILFEPGPDEAPGWPNARAAAEACLATLADHPEGFANMAAALSACPSGAAGGSLGQLAPGDLAVEVEDVLITLEPDEIGRSPVRSRFGWHVLRLDHRTPGKRLPFEAVKARIRDHLRGRAWTAEASRYVAGLAEQARLSGVALSLAPDGEVNRPSASLGDLLSEEGLAGRFEPWLRSADPALADKVQTAAAAAGRSTPEFVQEALADFMAGADDEAWTRLISAARDAEDPALACVASLLRAKIAPRRRSINLIRTV